MCILIKFEIQITTLPDEFPVAHSAINDLRLEYVVAIEGVVRSRPNESINKKMKTGLIEVYSIYIIIINNFVLLLDSQQFGCLISNIRILLSVKKYALYLIDWCLDPEDMIFVVLNV